MKKTLTKKEYYQLEGLKAMMLKKQREQDELIATFSEIIDEEDGEVGHSSDMAWDDRTVKEFLKVMKIEVIEHDRNQKGGFKKFGCELSAEGIKTFKDRRTGVVVGESRNGNNWRVVWDGNKVPQSYHKDYIKRTDSKI